MPTADRVRAVGLVSEDTTTVDDMAVAAAAEINDGIDGT